MTHRHGVRVHAGGELGIVLLGVGLEHVEPLRGRLHWRLLETGIDHLHGGLDVADHRACDGTGVLDLVRVDIDLDELDVRVPFLALAEIEHPVQTSADEQHDVGGAQRETAAARRAVWVIVRNDALGHRHRLEWHVGLLDEFTQFVLGLGQRRTLAHKHERVLGLGEQLERFIHRGLRRRHCRSRLVRDPQLRLGDILVERLGDGVVREIDVDTARTAGACDVHGAGHSKRNVFDLVDAERFLAELLRIVHLVEAFVFAFVHVDDMASGRTADHDDREAVRGGFKQRCQTIEEARRGNGERHSWATGEESFGSGSVHRVLLMAHADEADAHALCDTCEISDRDSDDAVHMLDTVLDERLGEVVGRIREILV